MEREFILLPEFERQWPRLGFDDNDLSYLQEIIRKNPKLGQVISGTGGLRKMRFSFKGGGKSGGVRVLYIDIVIADWVYLITAYSKGEKENITDAEKNVYKQIIKQIKSEIKGKTK